MTPIPTPSPHLLTLAEASPGRSDQVGGKAKGLHDLIALDLPVPPGFVVTADAYREALASAGVGDAIAEVLAAAGLTDEEKSERVRDLFTKVELTPCLGEHLDLAYAELGGGPVAVRSSGIAEDTAGASFAGQHDTYLWVQGAAAVRESVLRCWASLYNAGAIGYRAAFEVPPEQVTMAVVVQRMVPAVAGGVMMTLEPVSGDRNQIMIEAAHGLGEGVVVGDVQSDLFWFDKRTLEPVDVSINHQLVHHAYDPEARAVVLQPLSPEVGARPALDDEQAARVAALGRQVEEAFGIPMDVEWAVAPDGEVLLVQARPETVWSNRPDDATLSAPSVTHGTLNPDWYYSTANLGEAAPGVLAPLSWSVWGPAAEVAARYGFIQLGVLESSRAGVPEDERQRMIQIAYGRAVASVSAFYEMGERIPGASGDMIAESLLGSVPAGMTHSPTRRRYPHVLWRMPRSFARAARELHRQHAEIAAWYEQELARTPDLDLPGARAQLREATRRFGEATSLQAQGNIIAIPPVFDALQALVRRVDMEDSLSVLTAGGGDHAEIEVVADLWDLGRGLLDEKEFLRRHGFHGPLEGDIAGLVWREDPAPVRKLAELYRNQDASTDPRLTAAQRSTQREEAEAELLSRVGRLGRPGARLVLALARRRMPLRGIGKASFLRSLDVARAAARRTGTLLVEAGMLERADDVMYLTLDELTADSLPADVGSLVALRRAEQARYRGYAVPHAFWGVPPAVPAAPEPPGEDVVELRGIGASAGVVEGTVRVVTDPSFTDVEAGEILVAATTDPSWASVMFVSAALVVDIGGALSHAAVVARELGIPCVVNTGNATTALATGDRVRVDGRTGTVHVLERRTH